MKKNKKPSKRDIQDAIDDGVIEKPRARTEHTERHGLIFEDDSERAVITGRRMGKTSMMASTFSSFWKEGMVVTCPDKSKIRDSESRVPGTIISVFGSECLVLSVDGLIHRCFITELGS